MPKDVNAFRLAIEMPFDQPLGCYDLKLTTACVQALKRCTNRQLKSLVANPNQWNRAMAIIKHGKPELPPDTRHDARKPWPRNRLLKEVQFLHFRMDKSRKPAETLRKTAITWRDANLPPGQVADLDATLVEYGERYKAPPADIRRACHILLNGV